MRKRKHYVDIIISMTPEEYKQLTSISSSISNTNTSIGIVYVPKTGSTYLSLPPVPVYNYSTDNKRIRLLNSKTPGTSHMALSTIRNIVDFDTPIFTLMRDPYDRTCSEYYFIKKKAADALSIFKNWDLKDPRKLEFLAHHTGKLMGISGWGVVHNDGPGKAFYDKTYNIHKHNMTVEEYLEWTTNHPTYPVYYDIDTPNNFDCVGMTDEMDKNKALLKAMFNIDALPGNKNNNTNKKVGVPYQTSYSRSEFERNNAIEYEMYYEGRQKFVELCKKYF